MRAPTAAAWMLAVFLFVLAVVVFGDARGHDIYGSWTMPDNPAVSCCSEHDCRPVTAEMDLDGHWTAWPEGRETIIPANKIMRRPSPDGRSHWCGSGSVTFCFLPAEVRG